MINSWYCINYKVGGHAWMRDMYTLLQEIVIGLGSIGEEIWYIIQTSENDSHDQLYVV